MKKLLFLSLSILFAFQAMGQTNPEVFAARTITWGGLDFSKVKLIGGYGFTDPDDIANTYFDKWNQLILNEASKYSFVKAYRKDGITNDIKVATQQSGMIDAADLVIEEAYSISESDITQITSQYKGIGEGEGVGLIYIIEYFSKRDEQGSMYVVFFDLASGEVLHSQNYKTKPSGFGLRNYWAGTIKRAIDESAQDYKKAMKRLR